MGWNKHLCVAPPHLLDRAAPVAPGCVLREIREDRRRALSMMSNSVKRFSDHIMLKLLETITFMTFVRFDQKSS